MNVGILLQQCKYLPVPEVPLLPWMSEVGIVLLGVLLIIWTSAVGVTLHIAFSCVYTGSKVRLNMQHFIVPTCFDLHYLFCKIMTTCSHSLDTSPFV